MSEKVEESKNTLDALLIKGGETRAEILNYLYGLWSEIKSRFYFPNQDDCVYQTLNFCFKSPVGEHTPSIFGFAEFIAALALLVIVYTITDICFVFAGGVSGR